MKFQRKHLAYNSEPPRPIRARHSVYNAWYTARNSPNKRSTGQTLQGGGGGGAEVCVWDGGGADFGGRHLLPTYRSCFLHPHTSGGQCPRSCYHNLSGAVVEGGTWRREDGFLRPPQFGWTVPSFLYLSGTKHFVQ